MNAIAGGAELVVGLVNNIAGAFAATDMQFSCLLQAASPGRRIQLRRFATHPTLPGYEPIDALWHARLDGLIVTGAEPQATDMTDEPSWALLARLVEWAADHTQAAIWSCLAAHAAVFRLDGVRRRRLPSKLSGVFDCRRATAHTLLEDAPQAWPVPHSRFNDLDTGALERTGYTILARGPGVFGPGVFGHGGPDAFAKGVGRSTFLMLQGHPEYMADTLLREYRRDVRRWLQGADRPMPPRCYFDPEIETRLAGSEDARACLETVQSARPQAPRWLGHSVRLYQNWLAGLDSPAAAAVGLSTS